MSKRKSSIGRNATILGIAGIIVKILGAIYRIPLTALIKDAGIGYYQAAYPIYDMTLAISTAGLPIAVATMVSKYIAVGDENMGAKTFKVAFWFMAALGTVLAACLYVFARPIVQFLGNPGSLWAMYALVPAVLFSPCLAAYRGYYQGMEMMTPTAVSQVIVQGVRVLFGITLAYLLLPRGLMAAAGGASLGAGIGAFMGLIYMALVHLKDRKKNYVKKYVESNDSKTYKELLNNLIKIAIPISIGATILPIMDTIDIRLVMKGLLAAGFSLEDANLRFGWLKGMAQTLISLPQVISISLGVAIIPVISALKVKDENKKLQEKVSAVIKFILVLALPCAFGLYFLSKPIISMLYSSTGAEAINGTANILKILSISVVPLMLITVVSSILQAISKEKIPVYNLIVGGIFKIVITIILTRIPSINVYGAAIGSVIAFLITAILDIMYCYKNIGFKISGKIIYALIASVVMGFAVQFTHNFFITITSNILATLGAVFVGVIIYGTLLILTKTITLEEIGELKR